MLLAAAVVRSVGNVQVGVRQAPALDVYSVQVQQEQQEQDGRLYATVCMLGDVQWSRLFVV
jgi:hypothetical protein